MADFSDDESESIDHRLIQTVKEYMLLIDQGKAPPVQEFLTRFPEIASELEPCLVGLAILHNRIPESKCADPTAQESDSPPGDATMVFAKVQNFDDFDSGLKEQANQVNRLQDENSGSFRNQRKLHANDADDSHTIETNRKENRIPIKALGDFQIQREIGKGGMGIVYEAIQLSLGRRVALKVLSLVSGLDPIRLQRFRNEAQAAAQLHHTHIVPVYAVGSDRGVHYYAMQLIEGQTLAELMESLRSSVLKESEIPSEHIGPSTLANRKTATRIDTGIAERASLSSNRNDRKRFFQSMVRMIHDAALGIDHAHQYGIIHRDIKPANLMLDAAGKVWVTDFGLAQIQTDSNLTETGDMLGTLRYMSPEQISGHSLSVDARSDIYSLGVTLYELITLAPAVSGTGYQDMIDQIVNRDPPSPRSIDPHVPVELEIVIQKAIAKQPQERYATASELAADLKRWLDDLPIHARPPTIVDRIRKWRKRHAALVNTGIGFLCLLSIALAGTTLAIWNAQSKTATALEREKQQRLIADASFERAKQAVDTFTQLGESELSFRNDLRSLRQDFLETSLNFYQDFLELRSNDKRVSDDLANISMKVKQMVSELQTLDNLGPLGLLELDSIKRELELDETQLVQIDTLLQNPSDHVDLDQDLRDSNDLQQVADIVAKVQQHLSESQWNRLKEIHRQSRLPFTFKSPEIVDTLQLSLTQRFQISSIIEEERPDRAIRRMEKGLFDAHGSPTGPPDHPHERSSGMRPPQDDLQDARNGPPPRGDHPPRTRPFPGEGDGRHPMGPPPGPPPGRHFRPNFGPNLGPMPEHRSPGVGPGGFGPAGHRPHDEVFVQQTEKTVQRIRNILSADQRRKWDQLVGELFTAW